MLRHNRLQGTLAFAFAGVVSSGAFAATIDSSNALVPAGLNVGDSFHLVFVTSPQDEVDSTWTVAQVNTYVNNVANDVGTYSGSVVASLGLTWYAIASDTTTDARDNAVVSAPVYRVDGVRIATGLTDIWDGSIENTIDLTEQNTAFTYTSVVRTGSNSDGTAGQYPFGVASDRISRGQATFTDSKWITSGSENDGVRRSAYALSEAIEIVPEPSSLALLALGGLAMIRRRR